jgi:Ca-activated chloride channel family protein
VAAAVGGMNGWPLALHFLRPWWWLALLPLPLVLLALVRGGDGRAALARLADATLLPYLVRGRWASRRLAVALVALAWTLAVAALAGPAWQRIAVPVYQNGAARVIALSLSTDMLATDLAPSRMLRARLAVEDLLAAAGDARTALVAYAGAAFTVAPLTDDRHTVLNLLRDLGPDVMPVPGNDAAAGIARSARLLRDAHVTTGQIIVVGDTADSDAVAAARSARAAGYRVDVLGVGTPAGAPVPQAGGGFVSHGGNLVLARRDDAALRAVAAAGGGTYAALPVAGATPAFALPAAQAVRGDRTLDSALWRDGGIWLLPALVVLGAFAFRRGWLLLVLVCVAPLLAPPARAASWSCLWSNRDQRAAAALGRGDPATARTLATTPDLRGAADYRDGDYAAAAKAFGGRDDARSRYNLGNALARQGDYAKAIDAWKQALRRDPKLADARANIASVEDWLKQHRPPPSSGQPQRGSGKGASGAQRPSSSSGSGQPQSGSGSDPAAGGSTGQRDAASSADGQHGSRASAQPEGSGADQSADRDGAAAAETARQQAQARQAAQGVARELRQPSKPGASSTDAYALGAREPRDDRHFDAQQRALLRSVPDDPGALLRRMFRLEWEQRNGRRAQEGEP